LKVLYLKTYLLAPNMRASAANLMENSVALQKGVATQGNAVEHFSRTQILYRDVHARSATTLEGAGLSFSLTDSGGQLDYGGLFDAYRIDRVTVQWIYDRPITRAWTADSFYWNSVPNIGVVADFNDDDSSGLTSLYTISDAATYMYLPLTSPVCMSIVPRIAVAADTGGIFTGYANSPSQWISMGSPDVLHYGIKYIFDTTMALYPGQSPVLGYTMGTVAIVIKYELSFRSCH
jgi:hypothetical protein